MVLNGSRIYLNIFNQKFSNSHLLWKSLPWLSLTFSPSFQVSSIVQVVGIIICLHAATKISHRALGIASIASRWHALATCGQNDTSQLRVSNSMGNLEAAMNPQNSQRINYSESDSESFDYIAMPTNMQLASYMTSYHKRQAFGTNFYLATFSLEQLELFLF